MDLANIRATLRAQQEADPEIQPIIRHLLREETPIAMNLDRQLHRYALEPVSGIITYHNKGNARRFLVPDSLQVPIIELFHKSPVLGSHASSDVTSIHIKRYFY